MQKRYVKMMREEDADGDGDGRRANGPVKEAESAEAHEHSRAHKSDSVLVSMELAGVPAASPPPSHHHHHSTSVAEYSSDHEGTSICSGRGSNAVIHVDPTDRRKIRRQLVEELEALKALQARLAAIEQVIRKPKECGRVRYVDAEEGRGYGERADSAKPSGSGEEGADAVRDSMKRWSDGGDGFDRERTVVGARMALAIISNESPSRSGSKSKRERNDPEADTPEIFGNKRLKSQDALSSEAEENAEAGMSMSAEVAGYSWQNIWKQCLSILEDLLSGEHAWAFAKPVLEIWPQLCDYTSTIQTPMDLGTVKSKLLNGEYSHPQEFAADVRLIFTNAFTYNGKASEYYSYARKMKTRFEAKFRHVGMKVRRGGLQDKRILGGRPRAVDVGEERLRAVQINVEEDFKPRRMASKQMRRDNIPNPRLGRAASVGAYGGQRALTAREKEKLARTLETLPADRVRKVFEILKRRNPGCLGSARSDEIEVDLENFDEETMFELYRLAMNWQKSKKKVLSRLQSSSEKEPLPTVTGTAASSSSSSPKQIRSRLSAEGSVPVSNRKSPLAGKNKDDEGMRSLCSEIISNDFRKEVSPSASECSSSSSGSSLSKSSSSDSGSDSETDSHSEQGFQMD